MKPAFKNISAPSLEVSRFLGLISWMAQKHLPGAVDNEFPKA